MIFVLIETQDLRRKQWAVVGSSVITTNGKSQTEIINF